MDLTALLLTGGQSSRMGRDKSSLLFEGESLWARQLRLLRALQPKAVWISARAKPPWATPDLDILLDRPPSQGPLSGIALALERIQTSHLLVLAIDLVQMTSKHLQELVTRAETGVGVVPVNREWSEPLAAVYPKEAAELAVKALTAKELALQVLVKRLIREKLLREYLLNDEQRSFYLNLNSPADLPEAL